MEICTCWKTPPIFSMPQALIMAITNLFSGPILLLLFYICEIILYFTFWFISLSIISSRSIHVVPNDKILFYFIFYGLITFHCKKKKKNTAPKKLFSHSSIYRHLGCFYVLAIVHNATTNMGVQISFWVSLSISFEQIPRDGIAELSGSSIFHFMRNLCTVFHSGHTNLQTHQQCKSVPLSPYLCQLLLFLVFFMRTILISVKWYLILVFICMSLMIRDFEHLFIYLLAMCIFSLEKCLFRFFAHF